VRAPRILIIEDEAALANALATVCQRLGASTTVCASGRRGMKILAAETFSLIILDIGLPDTSGWQVLETVNHAEARPPALVITAQGTLDNALAARKFGAAAYLVKPLDLRELEKTILELLAEVPAAGSPARSESDVGAFFGGSSAEMQQVFLAIARAATTDAPALLTGPTGTGKTLAARVIHQNSQRRDAPFVTLMCGTVPEQLLESELFGHEKSAFTGATAMRPGHFERAAGGTLFLDEIGDIPPATQAKLLRFVEEKTFSRVGGREEHQVDLRLITATNRRLRDEVQAGRFREDLYYRLHVLEVEMPPLAKRRADIPPLSAFFLGRLSEGRELALASETSQMLVNYHWPGNVRELRNAIEHAVATCAGKIIQPQHLPKTLQPTRLDTENRDFNAVMEQWVASRVGSGASYKQLYSEVESSLLKHLLQHFGRKPTVLARALKMNRATLLKKRRNLGLDGEGR